MRRVPERQSGLEKPPSGHFCSLARASVEARRDRKSTVITGSSPLFRWGSWGDPVFGVRVAPLWSTCSGGHVGFLRFVSARAAGQVSWAGRSPRFTPWEMLKAPQTAVTIVARLVRFLSPFTNSFHWQRTSSSPYCRVTRRPVGRVHGACTTLPRRYLSPLRTMSASNIRCPGCARRRPARRGESFTIDIVVPGRVPRGQTVREAA